MQPNLRVIPNFALTHFNAARHFSFLCREVENANADQPLGNFFEEVSIYASSAVVSAGSALEALINELFLQPGPLRQSIDNFDEFFWGTPERRGFQWESTLKKYKKAITLLNKEPLSRDDAQYRQAEALIGFRNYLVHFKPLWDEDRRDESLEECLAGQFDTSPHMEENADFLAMQCMTHGCTEWAVNSVKEFIAYFAERSELDLKKLGPFCE